MATIAEHKFAESSFTGKTISELPDRPNQAGMSAADLKARFDQIGKVLIALGNFNDLIDHLLATTDGNSGADSIGVTAISGVTGADVQTALENLKTQLDNAIIGEFSPSGITDDMLSSDIKIGSLAALLTTVKTSLVNSINELVGSVALKADEKIIFADEDDTESRTLAITDRNIWLNANHASVAINYTVPLESSVAWERGDWIIINQKGAAQAAVVAAEGVTFKPADKLKVNGQNTQMVLVYDGNDEWYVGGSRKA